MASQFWVPVPHDAPLQLPDISGNTHLPAPFINSHAGPRGLPSVTFLQLKESLANTAGTTAASAHQLGPTALLWLSNGCTGTSSCPGNPPTHLHYVSNNEVQVPLPEAPPSSRPPASSLSDWPLPFCLIWTPQATIQVRLSPSQGLLSPSNFSDPPTNSLLLTSSL